MRRKIFAAVSSVALLPIAAGLGALGGVPVAAQNAHWGSNYFPNVMLTTQDGVKVRFYDDLIKGKIVAIDFIYTSCKYSCPLETARLAQVQKLLGDRMGQDVFFYSITIDPDHDTPEVLKEYGEKYHAGPGWLFLTGTQGDIDLIRKKIGLYSEADVDSRDGHAPSLMVGNEATGQWMRDGALDNPRFLAHTIGDWMSSWQKQIARQAPDRTAGAPNPGLDVGQYEFTNHCAPCHSIGQGTKVGPDLLGVTGIRDRAWLARFIATPDKVIAEGDRVAADLVSEYKVRMPNLSLADADVAAIIGYIERQSAAIHAPAGGARAKTPKMER